MIENENIILINTYISKSWMCITTKRKFLGSWNWKGRYQGTFYQCKNDFLDEFNEFRTNFFHEIKSFKNNILDTPPKNTGNQEHVITLLLDNIMALKNQSIFTTK